MGALIIRGDELFIKRLTVEKGEVDLDGRIDSFLHSVCTKAQRNQGLLSEKTRCPLHLSRQKNALPKYEIPLIGHNMRTA